MRTFYILIITMSSIKLIIDVLRNTENDILNTIINLCNLTFSKKIFMFLIIILSSPIILIFRILLVVDFLSNTVLLLFSLNKNVEIICPQPYVDIELEISEGIFDYKRMLCYIFNNMIFKIRKNSFFRLYAILSKKNNAIDMKIIDNMAFRYIFGIPIEYVKFMILIIKKDEIRKKKKLVKIRSILRKKVLSICRHIKSDNILYYDSIFKIKIKNFKIKTNGFDKINIAKNVNAVKMNGVLLEKSSFRDTKTHIIMKYDEKDTYFTLTRSSDVIYYNEEGKKERIKTHFMYNINNESNQYVLPIKITSGNKSEKFVIEDTVPVKIFDQFKIKTREEYIGWWVRISIIIQTLHVTEGLNRDNNFSKLQNMEIYPKLNLMDFANYLREKNNIEIFNEIILNMNRPEYLELDKYFTENIKNHSEDFKI
jgi:hypothetical protein